MMGKQMINKTDERREVGTFATVDAINLMGKHLMFDKADYNPLVNSLKLHELIE